MKKKLLCMLVVVLSLFMVACGSKGDTKSNDGSKSDGDSTSDSDNVSNDSKDKEITVAGIVFQEDQFMKLLQMGYQAAGKEYDAKVLVSNTNNDQAKEVELINTYTSQKIDGIAISPLNETSSIQALKTANDKGLAIAVCNTALNDSDFIVGGFTSDNYLLGKQTGLVAAEFIKNHYEEGEEVRVAILQFKSQLPDLSTQRSNGFIDQIKDIPGVVVVADQDAWLQDKAVQAAGDIITAQESQGGVDIIWGANDGGTIGSVMAVKNAGKEGEVFVFGTDAAEQQLSMLRNEDNVLQAVTGQDPYMIGYKTMEVLLKDILGEDTGVDRGNSMVVPGIVLDRNDKEGLDEFASELENHK
ncbi:hypothetical protein SH1V18_05760 [Vallitalea longa]|uniref:Periplasmic binding protein domain-containing protein n=1 Tax=Vallitalea longa TaxID=2936439 RepID=A0A9W6DD37_9FIRM|nr:substrate-binding domain-containing protein [Vallitalea longa]GKX28096.1 hypothetical protein SH1V18_05760 [Vallitalea longa]